jgi:hypothetical protein
VMVASVAMMVAPASSVVMGGMFISRLGMV